MCTFNRKGTFSFAKLAHNMLWPSLDKQPFPFKCLLNSNVIVQSEGMQNSAEMLQSPFKSNYWAFTES